MKKFILKSFTLLTAALLVPLAGEAQTATPALELFEANLKFRPWSQEVELLGPFAENSELVCQQWSPSAFEANPQLWQACQFAGLFKQYDSLLSELQRPDQAGLILPEVSLQDAQIPLLAAGVWQRVVFADKDGEEVALKLILLRLALEKSLEAHAEWIVQKPSGVSFNEFSHIVMPRLTASVSGYSQTLRTLQFLNRIKCDRASSLACNHVLSRVQEVREQVFLGLEEDNFLEGLHRLNESNSGRNLLKAKHLVGLAKTLQEVRESLSLQELIEAIQLTSSHALITRLKNEYAIIADGLGSLNDQEMAEMLTSVFILSEIAEAQNIRATNIAGGNIQAKPGRLSQSVQEEMNQLKSYVLRVFNYGEAVK